MHKFQQATQSKLQVTKDPYLVACTTLGEHRSIEIVIEFTLLNALIVPYFFKMHHIFPRQKYQTLLF